MDNRYIDDAKVAADPGGRQEERPKVSWRNPENSVDEDLSYSDDDVARQNSNDGAKSGANGDSEESKSSKPDLEAQSFRGANDELPGTGKPRVAGPFSDEEWEEQERLDSFNNEPRIEEVKKPSHRNLIIGLIIVLIIGLFVVIKTINFGGGSVDMIEQAVKMAPRDTVFLFAYDLTRDSEFNSLFGSAVKVIGETPELTDRLNTAMSNTSEQNFIKELSSYADGAGAIIVRLRKEGGEVGEDGALFVCMQRFRVGAPLEKTMQKVQEACVKGDSSLKYIKAKENFTTIHAPEGVRGFSWAISNNTLYVGTSLEDLKTILGANRGTDSLAYNDNYDKAVGKIGKQDVLLSYIDVEKIMNDVGLSEYLPQEKGFAKNNSDLVKSLRYGVFRSRILGAGKGKHLDFNGYVACDPKVAGAATYGRRFFNANNNITFNSLKYHPSSFTSVVAFNGRALWDLVYEIMGATPQLKAQRDLPDEFLRRNRTSMNELLNDVLSGEIAISIKGLAKIQGQQMVEAKAEPDEIASLPILLSIGLKDRKSFESFIAKFPQVNMFMAAFPSHKTDEGAEVYKLPFGSDLYLAVTNEQLLLCLNVAPEAMVDEIASGTSKNSWIKAKPLENFVKNGENRGVVLICEDGAVNREETAQGIRAACALAGKENSSRLRSLTELWEKASDLIGSSYTTAKLEKDGLYIKSSAEIISGKRSKASSKSSEE